MLLYLCKPGLCPHVVIDRHALIHIGFGAKLLRVAFENGVAQFGVRARKLHVVPLISHGGERIEQRFEYAEVRRGACGAAVRWKVEQDNRYFSLGNGRVPQRDESRHTIRETIDPLGCRLHVKFFTR